MDILFYYQVGVLKNGTRSLELSKQNKLGLALFCKKEGLLVTKEEFVQECWESKGVIVSDNTVRQTLFRLRSALADIGAPEDTLITQGRNGYVLKPGVIKVIDSDNVYEAAINTNAEPHHVSVKPSATADEATTAPEKSQRWPVSGQYALLALAVMLLFCGGVFLRYLFFTHELSFTHYKDEGGRAFFFSDNIRKDKNKEDSVCRIIYWLDKNNRKPADGPLIYVSADWRDTLSFLSCKKDITLPSGDCLTINVIGGNKK